jgi:hypothetical protein
MLCILLAYGFFGNPINGVADIRENPSLNTVLTDQLKLSGRYDINPHH